MPTATLFKLRMRAWTPPYAGMMAVPPACVGVVTCALPAGLGLLGTQQLVGACDSGSQINSDFTSDQPGRVEAAFNLDTFPGELSITKDLAASAGHQLSEASADACLSLAVGVNLRRKSGACSATCVAGRGELAPGSIEHLC
ncbi:hypothetical protein BKM30_07475 [Pseudomonas syringae pv. syringae]|nr:hypothetical protein BKM10_11165 [Pseudomonas syringae pv. syringae]POR70298.1 hypothetical protein BKM27_10695 [Pseudomonas syringae pv. syringae]POR79537.1 hypothetical protein BKM30_07475 [Pseudomonas syringae pv. syringae]